MSVANMGADRELHGIRAQFPGRSRSTNPARVFLARVFSDRVPHVARTAGIKLADTSCEGVNVLRVEFHPPGSRSRSRSIARGGVGQTLRFRLAERGFLDQDALPLVALPGPAESDDNRVQGRVARRPPCEGSVAALQKHQMGKVGAIEAERPLCFQTKEPALAQSLATFSAHGIADNPKYDDVLRPWRSVR